MANSTTDNPLATSATTSPPLLSFYKLFQSQHNSRLLLIPENFVKNLTGLITTTVLVRDTEGHIWRVKLEKLGTRLAMTKGWERFVSAHNLENGYWLLFHYIPADYVFDVEIFGLDCCLNFKKKQIIVARRRRSVRAYRRVNVNNKEYDDDSSSSQEEQTIPRKKRAAKNPIKFEEADLVDDSESEATHEDKSVAGKKLHFIIEDFGRKLCDYMKVPGRVAEGCDIEPGDETILRIGNGDVNATCKVTFGKTKDGIMVGNARLTYFWKMVNVLPEDTCEFEVVIGRNRKVKEIVLVNVYRKN